jgi:hypothetical protein
MDLMFFVMETRENPKHAIPDLGFVTQRLEHHFAELERTGSGAASSTSASPAAPLRGAGAGKSAPGRPRASHGRSRRA